MHPIAGIAMPGATFYLRALLAKGVDLAGSIRVARRPSNTHPLMLANTDNKLIAIGLLSANLSHAAPDVSSIQNAALSGRIMADNVREF